MKKIWMAGLCALAIGACTPHEQRVGTGAAVGAAGGAIIGGLATGRAGGAIAGGIIGAAAGAIVADATAPRRAYRCRVWSEARGRYVTRWCR